MSSVWPRGGGHSLALKADGTVVAWGENYSGQSSVPAGLTDVIAIAAGGYHSLALKADGTVVAWGENYFSQSSVPAGLTGIVAIAARSEASLALKSDGTVVEWGYQSQSTPSGLTDVVAIDGGLAHFLALKSNRTVIAWGANSEGQTATPVNLGQVIACAAGGGHSLALRDASADTAPQITSPIATLFSAGAYGSFTITASGLPAPLFSVTTGSLPSWASLDSATGLISGFPPGAGGAPYTFTVTASNGASPDATQSFTLNVNPSPTITSISAPRQVATLGQSLTLSVAVASSSPPVFQWKRNGRPIAGAAGSTYPIASAGPADVGWYQVIVTDNGGTTTSPVMFVNVAPAVSKLVGWGSNSTGQLSIPAGLDSLTGIAAAPRGVVALKRDGTIISWGKNLDDSAYTTPAGLNEVVAVAVGGSDSSLALKADGSLVSWGRSFGTSPPGLNHAVAIAVGDAHALALRVDGTVVAWGSSAVASVPSGLNNVIAIAAGTNHSLALKSDGTVVAWGLNTYGQCDVPSGLSNVAQVAAGYNYSLALKSDGTLVAWGSNAVGGTNVPSGLANVGAISTLSLHALALRTDGTVVA